MNYTLESTRFISRELVSGGKSYYANFHIRLTDNQMKGKPLPENKRYVQSWYPTTCDEEMKDVFMDVYEDHIQSIDLSDNTYTVAWKSCVVNKNEIISGDSRDDHLRELADKGVTEEADEKDEEKKEDPKEKKTNKKKPEDKEKSKEKSKPVKVDQYSEKTIDALVKKMNVALRKYFREVYNIKTPQQLSNDLQDEKDNIENAATKMYTDYLSRDDLKTLKSLKSDSEDVIKYVTMHLKEGGESEEEVVEEEDDEEVVEEEDDEEVVD